MEQIKCDTTSCFWWNELQGGNCEKYQNVETAECRIKVLAGKSPTYTFDTALKKAQELEEANKQIVQEAIDDIPKAYYMGRAHVWKEAAKLFNDAFNKYLEEQYDKE